MNWGMRIAILYLGFVALILTLAFTCFGQKTELESKDYYAKELKYQSRIDASTNANALSTAISHEVNGKSVQINVPIELLSNQFSGSVSFIRPSDSSLDKTITLQPDGAGRVVIADPSFQKGVYKMQISLISAGKEYYREAVVYFQ